MGDIRHKEIVVVALQRLAEDLAGKARKEILARRVLLIIAFAKLRTRKARDESWPPFTCYPDK